EGLQLQGRDIDGAGLLGQVGPGKGTKDRRVPLSLRWRAERRAYWRAYRPARGLFANPAQQPVHPGTGQRQLRRAVPKAGWRKPATRHTLRHAYATHLLAAGVAVMTLQKMRGH